jgi:hypothetical protein
MLIAKKLMGCIGGLIVYFGFKWLARLGNFHRIRQHLSPEAIARWQPLYPNVDLQRVVIKDHANIPANWFRFLPHTDAQAFHYRIYTQFTFNENDPRFIKLLLHELVHSEQVARLGGEFKFGCTYGMGFAEHGYWDHPLEIEARDFTEKHYAG